MFDSQFPWLTPGLATGAGGPHWWAVPLSLGWGGCEGLGINAITEVWALELLSSTWSVQTPNQKASKIQIQAIAWESPFSAACACNPALCCAWNARETSGETKMFKRDPQVWQQVPLIFTNCLTLPRCHGRKLHNLCSHCPWPGFCEAEWQIWPKMTSANDRQKLKKL